MTRKRGNNEGTIVRRKDGLWMSQISIGRHPETGKPKRVTFYGKMRKEVGEKLAKALRDQQQGIFVEPHKLTLGEWLDRWLWDYKKTSLRAVTFDSYEQHVSACAQLFLHPLTPSTDVCVTNTGFPEKVILN